MNIQQAKQLSLIEVMAALGHAPHHEARGDVWYLSPFRQEEEPSFKINSAKNIWYDFGEGQGGNIIDFAMKIAGGNTVAGALKKLAEISGGQTPLFTASAQPAPRSTPSPNNDSLAVIKILELLYSSLTGYLRKRGIDLEIARSHLQEIHYTREGRPYFSLAFTNDSGGYELRNPYFKGTSGKKDITTIAGAAPRSQPILVFEGFMDYLSVQTFYEGSLDQPVIVMNSVAMKERAVEAINGAGEVWLYLDHDEAGQTVKAYFQEQLEGVATIIDKSSLYAGYKDFNDFLVSHLYNQAPLSFQQ